MLMEVLNSEIIEQSEIVYMTDRMKAIQERPDNPMGVEIRTFGEATAFYTKEMPWPQFNTVKGIGKQEINLLDEIINFYESNHGRCQFEVTPSKADKALLKTLHDRHFYQSGFHASLYGQPQNVYTQDNHIVVRELAEDEFDLYAEIHCLGTGLPRSGKDHVADNNIVLYRREGWKFYIAFVHDRPAGVGVMYMNGGVASLTFATTLLEYRNQGVQKAILEKRISEASGSCELVVGQAAYASTSYRNMERAGMKLGYTRGTWIKEI